MAQGLPIVILTIGGLLAYLAAYDPGAAHSHFDYGRPGGLPGPRVAQGLLIVILTMGGLVAYLVPHGPGAAHSHFDYRRPVGLPGRV